MTIKKIQGFSFFKDKKIDNLQLISEQGHCNKNYILKSKNKRYLLRVFGNNDYYTINRKIEFKIQKKAYKKNLATKPYLLNLEEGFMLCDFKEGFHKYKLKQKDIINLAKTIKKLHKIKIDIKKYDLKKDLNYYKTLKTEKSRKLIKEIKKEYKKLKKYKEKFVLCHNDLNPKNIIFSQNKITFIDWEYGFLNDRFFDLATICLEFKLSKKQEKQLLKYYFKDIKKHYFKKLDSYKIINKNICKLWFMNLT